MNDTYAQQTGSLIEEVMSLRRELDSMVKDAYKAVEKATNEFSAIPKQET